MPSLLPAVLMGGLVAVILAAALQPLLAPRLAARVRLGATLTAGAVLAFWFAVAFALVSGGAFVAGEQDLPLVGPAILLPVLVFFALLWTLPAVSSVADGLDQRALVGFQILRVIGGIFIWLWLAADLPWQFAVPAGFGDVAVGLLALYAVRRMAAHPEETDLWAGRVFWAGTLDFVAAVGTGVATSPGTLQILALNAPNTLISSYPLALIPAFAVPLFMIGHILSWRLLGRPHARPVVV